MTGHTPKKSTSATNAIPSPTLEAEPGAWQALAVLLASMFMALLDTTVVNVALPTMQTTLSASESSLSWVIAGYALALGLALIPAGRIGDRMGHKGVFIAGVALFTAASVACGLAQSDTQLVIFRFAQGLGGGLFTPAVTAFIQLLFPGPVRGKAFAAMGAVIGISTAIGPVVGGLIIQAFGDANGWRLVFGINLPIGLVTIAAAVVLLPGITPRSENAGHPPRARIDWIGLVLLTVGLIALLVPLIQGQDADWATWTFLTIAAAVVLLVLFAAWEVVYARRGHDPLVPPRLFTHPAFSGGVGLAMVYFAAFTSIFFVLSILWQAGLGHTALETGLMLVPFAVGSIIASSLSDRLSRRLGRTVLILGTLLVTIGLAWTWLILRAADPIELTSWNLLLPLLIAGIGNGAFIAPNTAFIIATVTWSEAGAASGVVATAQRIGSAIGIAVVGSVLFSTLTITGPATVPPAFTDAAAAAMAVSTGLSLAALLLVFVLPRHATARPSPANTAGGRPVPGR